MADSSGGFQPIGNDPSLSDARLRAINQVVAPDTEPPEPEHPAITFARNLLSPMGPYGVPQEPPDIGQPLLPEPWNTPNHAPYWFQNPGESGPPPGPQPRPVIYPPDFNPFAAPSDQRGAAQGVIENIGNFLTAPNYGLPESIISALSAKAERMGAGFQRNVAEPFRSARMQTGEAIGQGDVGGALKGALATVGAVSPQPPNLTAAYQAAGFDPETAARLGEESSLVLGLAGPAGEGPKGPLGQRIAARAAEVKPGVATNEALAAARGAEFQPGTGAALKPPEQPRFTAEQVPSSSRFTVVDTTTGKPEPLNFSTREAAVAKAAQFNAPTPANPFAVPEEASLKTALTYVTKAKANPVGDTVGDVVRRAARASPEIVTPDFLAAEPEVRAQLNKALTTVKLPVTDENAIALAQQLLGQEKVRPSVGNKNAELVRQALGAPKEEPPIFPEPSGDLRTPAAEGVPPVPPAAPPPTGTGAMPPDVPLPMGPPKATAGGLAMEALRFATDIPRSLMVIGHLPILRQGLPLMADALVRGNPKEIPLALGRSFQAAVSSPLRAAAITQGFRDTVEAAGLKVGRDGVAITDPIGAIAAREEFGLHSFLARVPVVSNLNRIYPTMLNSLRTGAAVDLAKLYQESGRPIDSARIGHFVNIASGRGDIPAILDTPAGREILSGVFFGPRLTTSSWQMATDTIGSLARVGEDILSRRKLDPVEVAQVRTTAAYVATGVGIMKLLNSFGMPIGIDPTKTDFGRITLPDGKRLDLWGPFNENARLIAREIESIHGAVQGKPAFGARTGIDQIVSYFRSKLNAGVPTAIGDVLAGSTQGGESLEQAYGTPEALRSKLLPLPFAGQEAVSGSSAGPGMQAIETGLVAAGATVIDQPARTTFDGLGKPDTDPNHGNDPILDEYNRLMKQDPNFAKEPLQPPSTTIGSGRNSIKLPATEQAKYVQAVGEARRVALGALIYSQDYQNATLAQQEKMFKDTQAVADRKANSQYLAQGVIDATDPKMIAAEAVAGFHAQGGNARNEAYWVGLLDRAGKLTPDVARAIDESNVAKPGQKAPITVEEYRKAAPLVHEYLSHVPYGTDAHPIGTPADWAAVAQAHVTKNNRVDELTRQHISPIVADAQAQRDILKAMTSTVQRNIFLNGAQLENPQRKLIALKNPTLKRFFGPNPQFTRETEAEYQNFPFGQ